MQLLGLGFPLLLLLLRLGEFLFVLSDQFVSDLLDDLGLVVSQGLDSPLDSLVLLDAGVELDTSSLVLEEDLVDALLIGISVVGDWLDSVSVVLEVLVVVGVILALCHSVYNFYILVLFN